MKNLMIVVLMAFTSMAALPSNVSASDDVSIGANHMSTGVCTTYRLLFPDGSSGTLVQCIIYTSGRV